MLYVSGIVSRPDEEQAVVDFLDSAGKGPSALLVEGAAGIGKTTLCTHAVDEARRRQMRVLATRPAEAESVAAYSALADVLGGVEARLLERLPQPQLRAVDQVLLRADETDTVTEPRAVAAAFLAVVEALAVSKTWHPFASAARPLGVRQSGLSGLKSQRREDRYRRRNG
jgi:MoxR-like ATPase